MQENLSLLHQLNRRLQTLGRQGRAAVTTWSATSPLLAASGISEPRDLPAWIRRLEPADANDVLGALVTHAQTGDEVALLTVLATLQPGLQRIAHRTRTLLDDVLAEAARHVLEPRPQRRRIAAGIIRDTHRHLRPTHLVWDLPVGLEPHARPKPRTLSAGEELINLVVHAWRHGHLTTDQARLIIDTRVLGVTIQTAARRRHLRDRAAYTMREHAEARLIRHTPQPRERPAEATDHG